MFLLINKPKDWTSHDVVAYIRKVTKEKKVGHAGTLDPFATGLLIVGVGRASTKKLAEFKNLPKTYLATIQLGATSDTHDPTGTITKNSASEISAVEIGKILPKFIGQQLQIPPMYSAKKVNGKKLYELARQGKEIERQPVEIEIYEIKLLDYIWPELKIQIKCSPGTYIRSLASDIGGELGCGAYCQELERTAIGEYSIKNAQKPKELSTPLPDNLA